MFERKPYVRAILKDLLDRYLSGRTTTREQKFVERLYDAMDRKGEDPVDIDRIGQEIRTAVHQGTRKRGVHWYQPQIWYAAASILIILGIFIFYRNQHTTISPMKIAVSSNRNPSLLIGNKQRFDLLDTLPRGVRYTTINDEKVLALDLLADMESDEKLRIENPSRSVFSVLLNDSTQVWLNYLAAIEIDRDFNKNNRSVDVHGEVFFDVYKQYSAGKKVPFVVRSTLQTIEVLGTKFNVNASGHNEENVVLTEGSIRLKHNLYETQVIIKPGQQAFIDRSKPKILLIQSNNIEKASAWRKGLFYFENEKLSDVALEFEQWYGIKVIVDPAISNFPITGMISRYENIGDVLDIIQQTNNINYLEKKGKIYVTRTNP